LGRSYQEVILLSSTQIRISQQEIILPLDIIQDKDRRTIFLYDNTGWKKWQHFDSATNRFYKMIHVAPGKPPTIEISGIKMHITQNGDPEQDTLNKLKSFRHLHGIVLDTCTGLGYTAILSAQNPKVLKVFSCEKDVNVHLLVRQNPWSRELFQNPKIIPVLSAVQDLVETIPDLFVDTVIHDPPRFSLAAELYSQTFYQQLYRILKKGGELYHYSGDPNQKIRRVPLAVATQARLKEVGFKTVQPAYAGVVARK
ncbi:MAG: hypothetical protein A2Y94_05345, partial [Caldithrix sp. RBG_13_44_9]